MRPPSSYIVQKADIQEVLDDHPTLNIFGFGCYGGDRTPRNKCQEQITTGRSQLLNDLDTFDWLCEWFRQIGEINSINTRWSSYTLKHTAERNMRRYVANGTLIAAAIYVGLNFRLVHNDSPNCYFNISTRGYKGMRRVADER